MLDRQTAWASILHPRLGGSWAKNSFVSEDLVYLVSRYMWKDRRTQKSLIMDSWWFKDNAAVTECQDYYDGEDCPPRLSHVSIRD